MISQHLKTLTAVLWASCLAYTDCDQTQQEHHGVQESAFGAASQFVLHFTDAAVSDVVLVSDHAGELVDDQDVDAARGFLSLKNRSPEWELRYEYLTVQEFLQRVNQTRTRYFNSPNDLEEDPVIFVFPHQQEFINISHEIEEYDLVLNIWFISTTDGENLEELERSVVPKLNLRSMVFLFDETNNSISEWYKIGTPDSTFVRQDLARIGDDDAFQFVADEYIWDRRSDLRGYVFRTAYLISKPFLYEENGTFKGLTYDLAVTVQGMMNFSMDLVLQQDGVYGELLPNGTWLGLVGRLDRKEADVSIMDFSITETRSQVIDFGTGIYPQSAQLFMHLPRQAASWGTYVEVFDDLFWVLLFVVAGLSAVMFHHVFKRSRFQDQHRPISKSFASVMMTFGALNVPETATKLSTRSSFFSVCLFGALIYWVYNSVLVSLLTVNIVVLPINSMEELASKSQYQVILKDGDAYTQFFSQSTDAINPVAKSIYDKSIKNNPKAFVASQTQAGIDLMKDSNLIFFGESDGTKLNMKDYPCRIRAAPPRYSETPVTFAFQKRSPYVPLFNSKMLQLKQSGEVQKVMDKYLDAKSNVVCSESSFTRIGYENIFSAFVMLLGGAAGAAVISVYERVRMFFARRRDEVKVKMAWK